jgi:hypothetical protein
VLDQIKRMAARGDMVISRHARDRMDERGATFRDVTSAIATATAATFQAERDTWKVTGGTDLDSDDLTVVLAIEDNLIVITVF